MSKSTKPSKPIRLPQQTKEEQEIQIARFLANKKETFFQLILASLIQNKNFVKAELNEVIDMALSGADYAIVKLYPVEKKEEK